MAFEKGNEYGKTTSRKGVKNKVNLEIKESIKLIIENNLEQLQSDLDSLKANERVTAILQLLKYQVPSLKSVEIDATVENETLNQNETLTKLLNIPESEYSKLLENE